MTTLVTHIKGLIQTESEPCVWLAGEDMSRLRYIDNAWLLIEDDTIASFGTMSKTPRITPDLEIDATGRFVFPSFCDSHTHIVYAGSREEEFSDRLSGLSYEAIARRGGGILNSAKLLRETSEDELFRQSLERLNEIIAAGTGAVEIKSGYGLTTESEMKMLRVIRRLKQATSATVKATFLGAHAVPEQYIGRQSEYVDLIINEMIPQIACEELADYIDVFCDKGFFTVEDAERILMAGMKYGLRGKIHSNELGHSGGTQTGIKYGALSVDHLEYTDATDIEALLTSDTMPVVLPGAMFFLRLQQPPVRSMIRAGLPVALASDFNPGSSPSGNMKFVMSLACILLNMTPEEAVNAATLNGAYAMGISDTHGSIACGKVANFFITKPIPSYAYMPYAYTTKLIERVFLKGKEVVVPTAAI